MSDFNSSDEENENHAVETIPLAIDWFEGTQLGEMGQIGVCALPGCRFKNVWRSQKADVETIQTQDVQDVFVLCTKGEFSKYRSYKLLEAYKEAGIAVHHHPFPDGEAPSMGTMVTILEDLRATLKQGNKTIMHCYGGLGRSCMVLACLLMMVDDSLDSDTVIEKVKEFRGPAAIQSVKQFNFINDFKANLSDDQSSKDLTARSLSR